MNPRLQTERTLERPSRTRTYVVRGGRAVLVVTLALAVPVMLWRFVLDDAPIVPRVEFDNPSEYDIHVSIASSEERGVLPVGVARQRCVTSKLEVIDQGETWVVHFHAQGRDGGTVRVSRDVLARNGWRLRIPDEAIAQLRDAGTPPPPAQACPSH